MLLLHEMNLSLRQIFLEIGSKTIQVASDLFGPLVFFFISLVKRSDQMAQAINGRV